MLFHRFILKYTTALLALCCVPMASQAVLLSELANQTGSVLDCGDATWVEKLACEEVKKSIDNMASQNLTNITLHNGDLVYRITHQDNHPDIGFITGKIDGNCTTRLVGKGGFFEARANNVLGTEITGNMVLEPLILAAMIPVSVKYNQDLALIGGSAKPGPGCWDWWTDNFDYIGEAMASIVFRGVISLEPTVSYNQTYNSSTGLPEFVVSVTLNPIVEFEGSFLEDLNFSFREEGRNNSFGQVVWSVFSTAFNSVSGILALPFNGFDIDGYFEVYHEGIRGIFFNVLGSDLLVFSKNEFVAEDRFWEMVTELANKHFDAKDEFEDYFKDAEANFYKDLATALGLNSEGSVTYTYRLEDLQNKATAMLIPIISLVY
ncbi:hypothetical protein [Reinekea sp. G2M2-21]|uniref:hypothetical protein n=1 Tax=Reinekea sp. G2M2-21 TaxID=2788942 RepID=UPI0018AB03A2|nr:hypothetical protein [Reinekea sp. G2M2-21]